MFGMGTSVSPLEKPPERDRGAAQTASRPGVSKRQRFKQPVAHSCGAWRAESSALLRRVDGQRLRAARHVEKRIKVVKCSSVSTGQLRRLLALHNQPINLVVFQGTLGPKSNET